jgi:hypothetical protein
MSLSGTTVPTSDGRINWQLLILAWGLGLTISVAVATGLGQRGGNPAPPANTQAADTAVNFKPSISQRPPIMTVVILASEADANALRITIADYLNDNSELVLDQKWTQFAVVESPEQEGALWLMVARSTAELAAAGIDLQVLDLREE